MGISTYGFRGEALASIAAVAEVTLRTRREEDPIGCQVEFAASEHLSTAEVSAPKGSNFSVRNLFYNVPARRKFLKSDNVELRHITEEFTRVALTRPDLGFTLTHNGRDIFLLRPAKSLKYRIQDLLGASAADKLVELEAETTLLGISGFVCRPDLSKKTLGDQYFFINGRYFRSPYLHKAVMKAYEGLVPEGTTPSYFIYLEADPKSVDVNIHPAKTEIKFEDEAVVFQIIYACVKEALGRNSFASAMEFDTSSSPQMPVIGSDFDSFRPGGYTPSVGLDPDYNPFDEAPAEKTVEGWNTSAYIDRRPDWGRLFENETVPVSSIIILQGKYIASPVKDGLMLVHIRRALERVLYERFLKAISAGGHVSQAALIPVRVTVGAAGCMIIQEHASTLEAVGFDISIFGTDTVVVNGVPEGVSCDEEKVKELVGEVLAILSSDHTSLPGVFESNLAGKFALAAASSGKHLTSPLEARKLVDTLLGCDSAQFTPSGRKIITVLSMDEISKLF